MYGCGWADVTKSLNGNMEAMFQLRSALESLLTPIYVEHGGSKVESNFFTFETPDEALLANMAGRQAIHDYNEAHPVCISPIIHSPQGRTTAMGRLWYSHRPHVVHPRQQHSLG